MRITAWGPRVIVLATASAFVLSGCAANSTPSAAPAGGTGIVVVNGSEPQNPLVPTNTNETGGGKILTSIFSALVYYGADGAAHNELADSITTKDSTTYTIKVKTGAKFTNGEAVTAKSFVDAWQYGALASNKQRDSSFFENIVGFSDESDSPLTGLAIVDPQTFTVTLKAPQADFPLELGYTAFDPLPSVAFTDMKAFGENPVGNGPYMLDGAGAWKHNQSIALKPNPDYTGDRKPKNGGLSIVFYADQGAAYSDLLGGNLDLLDAIPSNAQSTFQADLGDRAFNQPSAVFQSFTIPQTLPHFGGQEGALRREALSMAINRKEITDVIFNGTRTPASDFTSPVINGWSNSLKGAEVLSYNPDKAKQLWAQADAISPWSGSFQIAFNSDGGHQAWVDAVSNDFKNVLGIDASGAPYAVFKDIRTKITNRTITTAFRTGWQADYPSLYNFLQPLYSSGASSNDGDYSNPDVDKLIQQGSAAADVANANPKFQAAQEILLKDLPAIPLWYSNVDGGHSAAVSNVQIGWNSVPLYYEIVK